MPKQKDPIWLYFEEIRKPNNSGKWAKCKICGSESQGITERLKSHHKKCQEEHEDASMDIEQPSTSISATRNTDLTTKRPAAAVANIQSKEARKIF